jgi:hypothetical protein
MFKTIIASTLVAYAAGQAVSLNKANFDAEVFDAGKSAFIKLYVLSSFNVDTCFNKLFYFFIFFCKNLLSHSNLSSLYTQTHPQTIASSRACLFFTVKRLGEATASE